MRRRNARFGFAALTIVLACCLAMPSPAAGKRVAKARESLRLLAEGNARFVEGRRQGDRYGPARRAEVASEQHPIAIVLSCSDSRVPSEIVFDQGIGDLFVVRVAGNVLDEINIGSIEYGAEHLHAPLVVVLGHQRCGAVTAAVEGGEAPGHIGSIVEALAPAVGEARKICRDGDLVEAASHANVRRVVRKLGERSSILAHLITTGKLSVVGAYYDLDSGKVEFLP